VGSEAECTVKKEKYKVYGANGIDDTWDDSLDLLPSSMLFTTL